MFSKGAKGTKHKGDPLTFASLLCSILKYSYSVFSFLLISPIKASILLGTVFCTNSFNEASIWSKWAGAEGMRTSSIWSKASTTSWRTNLLTSSIWHWFYFVCFTIVSSASVTSTFSCLSQFVFKRHTSSRRSWYAYKFIISMN